MDEQEKTTVDVAESEAVTVTGVERDLSSIEVKNPKIGRVLSLKEEVERQNELEKLRSRRIRQEQEYIDQMLASVEENLKNTREEQKANEEFEAHIKSQVYRMHGISADKLEGMTEARRAWYQGAAFALFFLSLVLIVLCGILHGFGSEICIFMAFYTAIEGALLSNGRKQFAALEMVIRSLYLLLFPMMLVIFVCYELGFREYELLVPIFTIAGTVVLIIGAVSYFTYDPYRVDRRNKRKANNYIRGMEKAALKEVRLKEKAFDKLERKKEKQDAREEKKRKRREIREEKRLRKSAEREEKLRQKGEKREEKSRQKNEEREEKLWRQSEEKEEKLQRQNEEREDIRQKRAGFWNEKKQSIKDRLHIEGRSRRSAETDEETGRDEALKADPEPKADPESECGSETEPITEPEIPNVSEEKNEPEAVTEPKADEPESEGGTAAELEKTDKEGLPWQEQSDI